MENRTPLSNSGSDSDEETMRRIDELMKDPKRLREAVESRMEKVVRNWPRR